MSNSYKGKILISTPDLTGDVFSRSVVLIIDHNSEGAFGLILNKKNVEVSQNIAQIFGYPVDVYEGGPVSNEKIFFIVKGTPMNEFFMKIDNDYYLTEDAETIVTALIDGELELQQVKVFSGYSGWSANQLESEIGQKFWTQVELVNLDYTSPNDQGLWRQIMENLGGQFLLFANTPEDISMN